MILRTLRGHDYTKTCLKYGGCWCVNWTKLAQERLRKSVLLTTGVTFRVP